MKSLRQSFLVMLVGALSGACISRSFFPSDLAAPVGDDAGSGGDGTASGPGDGDDPLPSDSGGDALTPSDDGTCTVNGQCAETCIDGLCTSRSPFGGACDDSADCAGAAGCLATVCTATGVATELVILRQPEDPTALGSSLPIVVEVRDAFATPVTSGADATAPITLSLVAGSGSLNGTLTTNAVAGRASFVFLEVSVTAQGPGKQVRVSKSDTTSAQGTAALSVDTVLFEVVGNLAWLGGRGSAASLQTSGEPAFSRVDGAFDRPRGVTFDGSGNVYVADGRNQRIVRLDSAGNMTGWLGDIGATPTGGEPGCDSAFDFTPGWCTGGAPATDSFEIYGLTHDGTYLYAALNRYGLWTSIERFDLATGAHAGWIGTVAYADTLLDTYTSGCTTTAEGEATPGWCEGGLGGLGNGDGRLHFPHALAHDGTYLYATNVSWDSSWIQRFDLATGAPAGWIGRTATAGSCAGADGEVTTGWCTDPIATSQRGEALDGSLNLDEDSGFGLAVLGGYLYAPNPGRSSVLRYDATTGAFAGWIGTIGVQPTGPPGPCQTAPVGQPTPTWCLGGDSRSDGIPLGSELNRPHSIAADATYLYITDQSGRIVRRNRGDGSFSGWVGRIRSGACAGGIGNATTAWCNDPASRGAFGIGAGMLNDQVESSVLGLSSTGQLSAADPLSFRVSLFTATTGASVGWLGASLSPNSGWVTHDGPPMGGHGDSVFGRQPAGIVAVADELFIQDDNRLVRYDRHSGLMTGWTGLVAESPTGGPTAGCSATQPNDVTPGWCLGGRATRPIGGAELRGAVGTGAYLMQQLSYDGTSLFVADSSYSRLSRFDPTSGAFTGWLGWLRSAPATGPCSGASPDQMTPGWCIGGEADYADALLGSPLCPESVYSDGTWVFSAGNCNHIVQRHRLSDGTFGGWLGARIGSTAPIGGEPGCIGAAPGTIAPGWCIGGSSDLDHTSNGDAVLNHVTQIAGDDTYLYFAMDAPMVHRFIAATGEYAGWIGRIDNPPTGGDVAGCIGAPAGSFTPGWCIGGSAGQGLPGFETPGTGIYLDGDFLYVSQALRPRINKHVLATGEPVGWKGIIEQTPTGGDPGCIGAPQGTFTPGWCEGGDSAYVGNFGFANGVVQEPRGLSGAGSFLYLVDRGTSRVLRIGK